jgi:hypothetical protein
MEKNYVTHATFGDIVYVLCVMRMIGPGDLYVRLNHHDEFARTVLGWPDAGAASGRLTQKDYEIIAPLLEAQDFIGKVAIWNGEVDSYPQLLDHWKMHLIGGWQGNQTECYALAMGWDIHNPDLKKKLLHEHWLTPVDPIRIPGKSVVVNRTNRHLWGATGDGWNGFIENGLGDYGVFIGTADEHAAFEEQFKIKIHYEKTEDLLHAARLIQGCEQFIGNQSSALSIAIGLGKTYWCELRADYENTKTPHGGYGDTWFPRINGFYF